MYLVNWKKYYFLILERIHKQFTIHFKSQVPCCLVLLCLEIMTLWQYSHLANFQRQFLRFYQSVKLEVFHFISYILCGHKALDSISLQHANGKLNAKVIIKRKDAMYVINMQNTVLCYFIPYFIPFTHIHTYIIYLYILCKYKQTL